MNGRRCVIAGFLLGLFILTACSSPVSQPRFAFETAQDSIELVQGSETSFWLNLKREIGFNELVELEISGLPEGVTQTWTRETSNGDCTVFLSAAQDVPPGTFTVTLRGRPESGGAAVNKTLNVSITQGSATFTLLLNPATLEIAQGQQGQLDIAVVRILGFSSDVSLSVLDAPLGVTGTFSPVVISNAIGISRLTLAVGSNVLAGTYTLRVQARSGSSTKTASLSLTVVQTIPPGFTLTLEGIGGTTLANSLPGLQNRGVVLVARVTRESGFTEAVTYKLIDAPAGVRGSFSTSILASSPDTSSLSLTIDHFTTPGTYTLKVRAETASLIKVKNFNLQVSANAISFDANTIGQAQRDTTYGPNARGFNLIQAVGISNFSPGDLLDKGSPMTLQADGKAVVTTETTMMRFLTTGALDTAFSVKTTGLVSKDVAVRSNGDIILTGAKAGSAAARFNSSGTLISAFDGDGIRQLFSNGTGRAILPVANGRILVAVARIDADKPKFTLVRLNADGTFDTTFSGDGNADGIVDTFQINSSAASTSNVAGDLVQDSQGRLVFAIIANQGRYVIGQRNANGDIGSGQTVDTLIPARLDAPPNLAIDAQNRILLLGTTPSSTTGDNFVITRIKPDGTKDATFGAGGSDGDGVVTLDFLGADDVAKAILVQPDGKIVVAGSATNNTSAFAIARLNASGTLDTTFGQGGKVVIGLSDAGGAFEEQLDDLALGSDGRIIASGHAVINSSANLKTIAAVVFRFKP